MTDDPARAKAGLLLGLAAYSLWGVMPLFFKALSHVSPTEIVAHRILWSLLFLGALLTLRRRWPALRAAIGAPRVAATLLITAILIAINWLVYIWAVLNGHVLEGSLGYYLNPLVNVLLGTLLLKERLSRLSIFAVALAACGVAVLAIGAGEGLWISLILAGSFALYGFLRKAAPVDSLEGLSVETVFLAPLAFGWVLWLNANGAGGLGMGAGTAVLLALSGVVTATPLLLFTAAAKRLPYSTLGFLQYIAPSLQFLLAVLLFGEPLTRAHIACFAAIWIALLLFAVEGVKAGRAAARARARADLERVEADRDQACAEPCGVP